MSKLTFNPNVTAFVPKGAAQPKVEAAPESQEKEAAAEVPASWEDATPDTAALQNDNGEAAAEEQKSEKKAAEAEEAEKKAEDEQQQQDAEDKAQAVAGKREAQTTEEDIKKEAEEADLDDEELKAELEAVEKELEEEEQEGSGEKEHINIVFIGHVDAGKSTISGAILLASGMVDARDVEKLQAEAQKEGRESWWKAFLMDTNEEERSKGKTVEVARSHFETDSKMYTILDAPGHKAFVPNMISGTAQADLAVLVISARRGEFEAGFKRGGQTREHAMLAKTLGVTKLVVAVNKMDEETVQWSEKRWKEINDTLSPFLRKAGFKSNQISWVPLSGMTAANLKERVGKKVCPWWDGPSLLELLDEEATSRVFDPDAALRIPLLDRFKEQGKLTAIGKIEGGTLKVGDSLVVVPGHTSCTVSAIESEFRKKKTAKAGDNVSIVLKGINENELAGGFMLCKKGEEACPVVEVFDAQIVILELPPNRKVFSAGFSGIIHLHTAQTDVMCEKIICEIDRKTGKRIKKRIDFAKKGMPIIARFKMETPTAAETFKSYNQLSRFTLRDEGLTVAVGKILKIVSVSKSLNE